MGLAAEDNIREGIGGQRLRGMIGGRGLGGMIGGNMGRRDVLEWAARNSSAVEMSFSRFREESSLWARVPADCCCGTLASSSSSSEGKKSDG